MLKTKQNKNTQNLHNLGQLSYLMFIFKKRLSMRYLHALGDNDTAGVRKHLYKNTKLHFALWKFVISYTFSIKELENFTFELCFGGEEKNTTRDVQVICMLDLRIPLLFDVTTEQGLHCKTDLFFYKLRRICISINIHETTCNCNWIVRFLA